MSLILPFFECKVLEPRSVWRQHASNANFPRNALCPTSGEKSEASNTRGASLGGELQLHQSLNFTLPNHSLLKSRGIWHQEGNGENRWVPDSEGTLTTYLKTYTNSCSKIRGITLCKGMTPNVPGYCLQTAPNSAWQGGKHTESMWASWNRIFCDLGYNVPRCFHVLLLPPAFCMRKPHHDMQVEILAWSYGELVLCRSDRMNFCPRPRIQQAIQTHWLGRHSHLQHMTKQHKPAIQDETEWMKI